MEILSHPIIFEIPAVFCLHASMENTVGISKLVDEETVPSHKPRKSDLEP